MMSEQVDKLFAAICKAQMEIKVAPKDSNNPFFKSKYADLQTVWETVKGPLSANGLFVVQPSVPNGDHMSLITILGHTSGQWIKCITPMNLRPTRMDKNGQIYETHLSAQEVGSLTTYYKRMALSQITGCYAGEADDDGNEVSGKRVKELINDDQIKQLIKSIGTDTEAKEIILKRFNAKAFSDIPKENFATMMTWLESKKEKANGKTRVA